MLTKKELIDIARTFGNTPWQQEKHYIQSLVLGSIADEKIVFKGGTYLWFFHGLIRFSEDLDFTLIEPVKNIEEKIEKNLLLFDIETKIKKINEKGLNYRIEIKGPLFEKELSKNFVFIEISDRKDLIQKPLNLKLNTPYKIPEKNVLGMTLEEVASEKVRAIIKRNKPRDIFDLNFLITKKNIGFDKKLVQKKLDYYNEIFSKKTFIKKIDEKEGDYFKEMNYLLNDKPEKFLAMKKNIVSWLEQKN